VVIDKGKAKGLDENALRCHVVLQESYRKLLGIEPEAPRSEANVYHPNCSYLPSSKASRLF
jgi:hypothetical protein